MSVKRPFRDMRLTAPPETDQRSSNAKQGGKRLFIYREAIIVLLLRRGLLCHPKGISQSSRRQCAGFGQTTDWDSSGLAKRRHAINCEVIE